MIQLKTHSKLMALMGVFSVLLGIGGKFSFHRYEAWKLGREREERIALQGKPWNGGKPTAPVQVESSLEGEIPADEWVDVDLSIIPQSDCTVLTSQVRGVDGLEVSDDSAWTHTGCVAGGAFQRQLRVKVPAEVSGLLAIDLHMEVVGGAVYDITRSVGFRAQGTPVLLESK